MLLCTGVSSHCDIRSLISLSWLASITLKLSIVVVNFYCFFAYVSFNPAIMASCLLAIASASLALPSSSSRSTIAFRSTSLPFDVSSDFLRSALTLCLRLSFQLNFFAPLTFSVLLLFILCAFGPTSRLLTNSCSRVSRCSIEDSAPANWPSDLRVSRSFEWTLLHLLHSSAC